MKELSADFLRVGTRILCRIHFGYSSSVGGGAFHALQTHHLERILIASGPTFMQTGGKSTDDPTGDSLLLTSSNSYNYVVRYSHHLWMEGTIWNSQPPMRAVMLESEAVVKVNFHCECRSGAHLLLETNGPDSIFRCVGLATPPPK